MRKADPYDLYFAWQCLFCADLAKKITVRFLWILWQHPAMEMRSKVRQLMITKDLDDDIDGRHCLIVEDIIDSGNTLSKICGLLVARNPASLKIATLLDKPDRREVDVEVDYTGFVVPDKFIVGYGLDYAQKYRNLPYLGEVEFVDE